MIPVTPDDFRLFVSKHRYVDICGYRFSIGDKHKLRYLNPPYFKEEIGSVWNFPYRGTWATHKLNTRYRGNCSPYVVRNLLLKYTKKYDIVLDPFVGSGTTLIECKLLDRYGIGVDINYNACILTLDRLNFDYGNSDIKVYNGDARNLCSINDNSVDFIFAHPPYSDIIKYSSIPGDLSNLNIHEFLHEIKKVSKELYRVLKPGGFCCILMGDTRKNTYYIPIAFSVMEEFISTGFRLKEDIIKIQHNTGSFGVWNKRKNSFYLILHEHIFVFEK